MRILITGASGLLGSNLALAAAPQHDVIGVVNANTIHTRAFTVQTANLLEPGAIEALLEQTQPDWVINCAALADLEACKNNPDLARLINTEMPGNLARIVKQGGARLLHVSTDAVFDGQKGQYTEADTPNPLSTYAHTKLNGEIAVLNADPDTIVARVNLFGFSPTGRRSLAEFFLNNLQAGTPIKGFTDVFFCPMLVNEIGRVFLQMLDVGLSGVYHVFSRDTMSKYAFGVQIAKVFGLDAGLIAPISVEDFGLQAKRSPNLTMVTHKLSTALGQPMPELSTMIHSFYTLYQQNYPQQLRSLLAE